MKTEIIKQIFTREGGASHPPYDSLNVRFGIGDNEDDVLENRRRICEELRIEMGQLVSLNQVHSDRLLYVDELVQGEIDGYDAMITDVNEIFLMIQVADCQAVMIWDPKAEVVANVHNGWKGSVQNIVGKTVHKMIEDFGCEPKNIKVEVSPSLGPCHAEFSDPYNELPKELHEFIDENNHVDFWKTTEKQCMDEGIKRKNIKIAQICTVCNKNKYFSHRADINKQGTGRFASVIGMR
ncbi:peptidoglycan editing factor PgeF [Patescibacteria group bacterium]